MAKQKQSPPPRPAAPARPAALVVRGAPDQSKSIFDAKNESVLSSLTPQDRFLYDVAREWFNYEYATKGSSVADNPAMAAGMQRYRALKQSLTPKQIEEVNNFIAGNNPAWLFFLEGSTGNQFYFTPNDRIPNGAPQSNFFPASGAFARPGTSFVNSNQNANQTPIVVNQASAQVNPVNNNYSPPPQQGTTFKSLLNAEMQNYIQEFVPQDNTVRKSALLKAFSGQPMTPEEAAWVSQNAASDYNVAHTMQYYKDLLAVPENADQAKQYASRNQNNPILMPDASALSTYAVQYFQAPAPASVAPPAPAAVAAPAAAPAAVAPSAPAAVAAAPAAAPAAVAAAPAAVAAAPAAAPAAVAVAPQPSWNSKNLTAAEVQARAQQAMLDAEIVNLFASSDPEELALFTSAAKFINTGETPADPIEAESMFSYIQSESPLWMSYVKKNYGDPYRFVNKPPVNAAVPSAGGNGLSKAPNSGTGSKNNLGASPVSPNANSGGLSVYQLTAKDKEAAILQEAKRMTAEQNQNAADEKSFAEDEIKNKEMMAAMESANIYSNSNTVSNVPQEQMYSGVVVSGYDPTWFPNKKYPQGNIIPVSPKINTVASLPQERMYGSQIGGLSDNYASNYPQMYQAGASNALPPSPPPPPPFVSQDEMYSWPSQGNVPKLNTVSRISQEQMYGPQIGYGFPDNYVDSYPQMYQAGASNAPPPAPPDPPSPPLLPPFVSQDEMYSWPYRGNPPKLNTVSGIPQEQMYSSVIPLSSAPADQSANYWTQYNMSPGSEGVYGAPQGNAIQKPNTVSGIPQEQMYNNVVASPYDPVWRPYGTSAQGNIIPVSPKLNTVSGIPQEQMYSSVVSSPYDPVWRPYGTSPQGNTIPVSPKLNTVSGIPQEQMYSSVIPYSSAPADQSANYWTQYNMSPGSEGMYGVPQGNAIQKPNTVSGIPQEQMYSSVVSSPYDPVWRPYGTSPQGNIRPVSPKLSAVSSISQEQMYSSAIPSSSVPADQSANYWTQYNMSPGSEGMYGAPQGNAIQKLNTVSGIPQEQMYSGVVASPREETLKQNQTNKWFDPAQGLYEALESNASPSSKAFDPARGLYEALASAQKKQIFNRRPAQWGGY